MRKELKFLFITLFFSIVSISINAQNSKTYKLKADFEYPSEKEKYEMWVFQGIKKLNFTLENDSTLINKDFKILIREYENGKLKQETLVIDTKDEPRLPKINSDFGFNLYAQNLLNYEKVAFIFDRFSNKKSFKIKEIFNDGDFSLRQINVGKDHLDFRLNEPFQIALITPPNRNPSNGELGYCQVSQGGIEIDKWYDQYKIPQFFLIYLEIG